MRRNSDRVPLQESLLRAGLAVCVLAALAASSGCRREKPAGDDAARPPVEAPSEAEDGRQVDRERFDFTPPEPANAPPLADAETRVRWRAWTREAFDEAVQRDAPVLLNLTVKWCEACETMMRITYNDPEVADRVERNFLPIHVDGDERPDIAGRYGSGGWPTTAFLTPDGEIIAGYGLARPEEMVRMLDEASENFRKNRKNIEETVKKNQKARAMPAPPAADPEKQGETVYAESVKRMLGQFDAKHGGFGGAPKMPRFELLDLLLLEKARDGDSENVRNVLEKTIAGLSRLADPEFGGFWHYAEKEDWSSPHYEKLGADNARFLIFFIEAVQAMKDPGPMAAVKKGLDYADRFLADADRGGFWAAQGSAVESAGARMEGKEYYALSEKDREAAGYPGVDRTMYVSVNALFVKAWFKAAALFDEPRFAEFAWKTLDRLFREAYSGGSLRHAAESTAGEDPAADLIEDRAALLDALLAAYEYGGKKEDLKRAAGLAEETIALLGDPENGGFYYAAQSSEAIGELQGKEKPAAGNASLAWSLSRLFFLTGREEFKTEATRAVAAALAAERSPGRETGAADLYRAAHFPVEFTIVGPLGDPRTRALQDVALDFFDPRKVIQTLDPERDPERLEETGYMARKNPSIYACVDTACSMPVDDPSQFELRIGAFLDKFLNEKKD